MNKLLLTLLTEPLLIGCQDTDRIEARITQHPKTFCNPVNLNYRFMKIDGGEGIHPSSHEPYVFPEGSEVYRNAFGGYAQVIVASDRSGQLIELTAISEGLKESKITIETVK